jgi:GTP-sensing pleiotropic transcriptional regulator CodY
MPDTLTTAEDSAICKELYDSPGGLIVSEIVERTGLGSRAILGLLRRHESLGLVTSAGRRSDRNIWTLTRGAVALWEDGK